MCFISQNKSSPANVRRLAAKKEEVQSNAAKVQRPSVGPMKVAILKPRGKSIKPNYLNLNHRTRSTSVSSVGSEEGPMGSPRKQRTTEGVETKHPIGSVTEGSGEDNKHGRGDGFITDAALEKRRDVSRVSAMCVLVFTKLPRLGLLS